MAEPAAALAGSRPWRELRWTGQPAAAGARRASATRASQLRRAGLGATRSASALLGAVAAGGVEQRAERVGRALERRVPSRTILIGV